jgi:hypothetical protein
VECVRQRGKMVISPTYFDIVKLKM